MVNLLDANIAYFTMCRPWRSIYLTNGAIPDFKKMSFDAKVVVTMSAKRTFIFIGIISDHMV